MLRYGRWVGLEPTQAYANRSMNLAPLVASFVLVALSPEVLNPIWDIYLSS